MLQHVSRCKDLISARSHDQLRLRNNALWRKTMTTFTDLCPKSDVELTPIIDKAMETALRFMEEGRSSRD
jgi:hypothetical protein